MGVGPRVAILLLLVIAACHQPARLASVQPEPAGEHCANGGVLIRTGSDDNGNGELDATEIDSESYVCAGEGGTTGHDSLADTQPIAPGAECTNGGTRVRTGIDVDDDGMLEDAEVVKEIVVCAPDAGAATAIATRYEPPGNNCELGGTAIESGPDANGNGVLETSEVTSTTFVCNGAVPTLDVVEGIFYVRTGFDIALLAGVRRIIGVLDVTPVPGIDPVIAPKLERVDRVQIESSAVHVELPVLLSTDILFARNTASLVSLLAPQLASAQSVLIDNAPKLATLDLSALATVTNEITLTTLPQLSAVDLPSLQAAASITIDRIDAATRVDAAALASITGAVTISRGSMLTQVVLPGLTSIGGKLSLTQLPVLVKLDLSALTSVAGLVFELMPSLQQDDVTLGAISQLPQGLLLGGMPWTSLGRLSALQSASFATVFALPRLTTADLPQLQSVGALQIAACAVLVDIDGFHGLQGSPSIRISDNPELVRIAGFDALASTGPVEIVHNPKLTAITAFSGVTSTVTLTTDGNDLLTTFTAFPELVSAGTIEFFRNPGLQRIANWDRLATIDRFSVFDAPLLTSIELPALTTIKFVTLNSVPILESIAMPALTSITGGPTAFANINAPRLPACQITDLFVQAGFTGTVPPLPPCRTIDRCRLVAPLDVVTTAGTSLEASGQLRILGVTDQTAGIDADVVVRSAVGIGDAGTDPTTHPSWTFVAAPPRAGWNDTPAPGFDEYAVTFVAPAGSHDIAFRFSGDGGRTWTYCDRNAGAGSDGSEDGYQPAHAGHVEAP